MNEGMTKRERQLYSDGALAASRNEDLAASGYARLTTPESRAAFKAGYESQRQHQRPKPTPEQLAEFDESIATLKAFLKEL